MISACARRGRDAALLLAAGAMLAGCDSSARPRNELRFTTDDFVIRVSPESKPTRALETIYWRVVVHERDTRKPVQGGEGRVFATNRDRKTTSNGLEETGELGTYRTHLMFVTAGMWAMAVQFRRDSTQPLQRTADWTQDIVKADEPGDFSTPSTTRHDTLPSAPPRPPGDTANRGS
jgi:hypothetical protein